VPEPGRMRLELTRAGYGGSRKVTGTAYEYSALGRYPLLGAREQTLAAPVNPR
jgi:hypothetical protein